jgi:hypothetical protein
MEDYLAIQSEIILIAAVIAIGLIAVGKAIMTGFAISRRPSHHLAVQNGHIAGTARGPNSSVKSWMKAATATWRRYIQTETLPIYLLN